MSYPLPRGTVAWDHITGRVVEIVGTPPWTTGEKRGVRTLDASADIYIREVWLLELLSPLEALGRQADV